MRRIWLVFYRGGNPKFEARSTKQYQMTKTKMTKANASFGVYYPCFENWEICNSLAL